MSSGKSNPPTLPVVMQVRQMAVRRDASDRVRTLMQNWAPGRLGTMVSVLLVCVAFYIGWQMTGSPPDENLAPGSATVASPDSAPFAASRDQSETDRDADRRFDPQVKTAGHVESSKRSDWTTRFDVDDDEDAPIPGFSFSRTAKGKITSTEFRSSNNAPRRIQIHSVEPMPNVKSNRSAAEENNSQ